jgi:hypothetical protein
VKFFFLTGRLYWLSPLLDGGDPALADSEKLSKAMKELGWYSFEKRR